MRYTGCYAVLKKEEYFNKHKRTVDGPTESWPCDLAGCSAVLKRRDYLIQHKRKVHGVVGG